MKTTIICTALLCSIVAYGDESSESKDRYIWPMFRKADVVPLEGKDIPAAYKRYQITDSQGRSIKGNWLLINRKDQVVKFRRTSDSNEFEIKFDDLGEADRRYAELETGEIWKPLWPDVLPAGTRTSITLAPWGKPRNAEWVRIDRDAEVVHVIDQSGEGSYNFSSLSDEDLAYAKDENTPLVAPPSERRKTITIVHKRPPVTGEWLEVDPYKQKVKFRDDSGNERYYRFEELDKADREYAENKSGTNWPRPKFDPSGMNPTSKGFPAFVSAWGAMTKAYTQKEIFDHLRVRTLTSAFLYEYSAYCIKEGVDPRLAYIEAQRRKAGSITTKEDSPPKKNVTSLDVIMNMLAKAEPPTERVSLKAAIEKSQIKLYEEPTPFDPPAEFVEGKPNFPPRDANLHAMQFIAQYMRVSADKSKIPFAELYEKITPRLGGDKKRYVYHVFDDADIVEAIEKTYGVQLRNIPNHVPCEVIQQKMTRHLLRNNQPVYTKYKTGYAVITGFSTHENKETTYEAYIISDLWTEASLQNQKSAYHVRFEESLPQSSLASPMTSGYWMSK